MEKKMENDMETPICRIYTGFHQRRIKMNIMDTEMEAST